MSQKPTYFTVRDLVRRYDGIYTESGIRSWLKPQHQHRGPKRCDELRPLVAFTLEAVEEFERTNAMFKLRAAKRGAQ